MGVYPGIPSVPQVYMFDMREEVSSYDCFVSQKKKQKKERRLNRNRENLLRMLFWQQIMSHAKHIIG